MEEYHKIQSLFLRDPATKLKTFLMGQWTMPEFEYLRNLEWIFEEKVDGTNIRIGYDGEKVEIGGRTKDAQTPTFLTNKLHEMFPVSKFKKAFPDCNNVLLFGEGYGAKIQKGGGDYIRDGVSFILFDVKIGDWWLKLEDKRDVATKLGIEVVPVVGTGSLHKAIQMCEEGFPSVLRLSPPEGLILRPQVDLWNRKGERIISKLKLKDFQYKSTPLEDVTEKGGGE